MKRIIACGLAAVLALSLAACGAAPASSAPAASAAQSGAPVQKTAPETAPDAVLRLLKEHHPDPFIQISEADFTAKVEALDERWGKLQLSEGNAWCALRELAASIKDAHTMVLPQETLIQRALPVLFRNYEGRWIILQAQAPYGELAGKELTAINGVPITQLAEKVKPLISYEYENWANVMLESDLRNMRVLQYVGAADDMRVAELTVRDVGTEAEETVTVDTASGFNHDGAGTMDFAPTMIQSGLYRAAALEDGSIFIQYNACQEAEELSMADFAQQLGAQLEGYQGKILVDLRNNGGGDSRVIQPLLQLLKDQQRNGAKVYGLIGANTFSSAVMNAQDLRDLGAVLVGETTGGTLGGFGELGQERLPNGCTLYYSTRDFGDKGPLDPDETVPQTVADLLAGKDTAVAYILSL